ncbi:multifunctional methyltransferase subunit TRM112-like protein [Acanthaster planci]|uniref:Multifunctional methyltransferase subunit TRM112-like protein n=1 Tax=Acanthaster planci TaxID=133434 RepID=A0A8B7ZQT0_ACAPL|nr:multifunctional methyltransferase subunit TRM112-like protein [Acanthaster planci]
MRLSLIRRMKLLTHNMLTSHVKGVKNGYPLKIEVENMNITEVEFNPEFISRMIPRLEWKALYEAAQMLDVVGDLPAEPVADYETNEEFLRAAHRVMLEVEVLDGFLVCPESGRKFPIKNGIPNMLLNEDEV